MSDPKSSSELDLDKIPVDFHDVLRILAIIGIRAMLAKLSTVTEVTLPREIRFEDLDVRALHAIEARVRDTLRTLGGAR